MKLWAAFGERAFLGVHLPQEYGGGGIGLQELTAVLEETGAAGCPLLKLLVSPGIIGTILARHGTAEQKDRWLRRHRRRLEEVLVCADRAERRYQLS